MPSVSRFAMTDLAWVAGFLEGEGCFTSGSRDWRSPTGRTSGLRVSATQKGSPETVNRCSDIFGGTVREVFRKGYDGIYYEWAIFGVRAAGAMMTLYSLLSERRKTRIAEVLEVWKSRPVWGGYRTHCLRGHLLPPSGDYGTVGHRRCKVCSRDQMRRHRARKKQNAISQ